MSEAALAALDRPITKLLTGCSPGADVLATRWAHDHQTPTVTVPVDWAQYGGRAQCRRDEEALARAQVCILLWDGFSQGTAQMIALAQERGVPLILHQCNPQSPRQQGKTTLIGSLGPAPSAWGRVDTWPRPPDRISAEVPSAQAAPRGTCRLRFSPRRRYRGHRPPSSIPAALRLI